MLKQKRTRLGCLLLACVMLLLVPVPIMAEDGAVEAQETSTRAIQTWEIEHNYSEDIIDGGIYYLRNVGDQGNLDVDNAGTANGTGLSTYPHHGNPNQKFQVIYLGEGLYEIKPVYVNRVLHVASDDELVIMDKNRSSAQRFKLKMQTSSRAIILSEASGFTKALCYDAEHPRNVKQKDYSSLSVKTYAQWEFIRADSTAADLYRIYYIKHAETGHYLDAVNSGTENGTLLHTCRFYGNSNEEWKLTYDYTAGAYYLKAGHRRDMAVDYTEQRAKIRYDGSPTTQGLSLIPVPIEGASDTHYRIATTGGTTVKYLSQGDSMADNVSYLHYVDFVENADDLWLLEEVTVDMKTPEKLTLNEFYNESIDMAYHETEYYVYAPEKTSRYKVELENNSSLIWSVVARSDGSSPEIEAYTRESSGDAPERRVSDVFLEAGEIYYIAIRYIRNPEVGTINIRTRVRQWVFVGHSYNWAGQGTIVSDEIDGTEDSIDDAMGFNFNHPPQFTATQAKQATSGITGYSHFNSEIFMYSGHGAGGIAAYEGTYNHELLSTQLPDMSNCELVFWNCCLSARDGIRDGEHLPSLLDQSITNGAKTAIGWDISICSAYSTVFADCFFGILAQGYAIYEAAHVALQYLEVTLTDHENHCDCGINVYSAMESLEMRGDCENIIFPQ